MKILSVLFVAMISFSNTVFAQSEEKACRIIDGVHGEYYTVKLKDRTVSVVGFEHGSTQSLVNILTVLDEANKALAGGATCDDMINKVLAVTDAEASYVGGRRKGYESIVESTKSFKPVLVGFEAAYIDTPRETEFNQYLRDEVKKFEKSCDLQDSIFTYFIKIGVVSPAHIYAQDNQLTPVGVEDAYVRTEGGKFFAISDEFAASSASKEIKNKVSSAAYGWLNNRLVSDDEVALLKKEMGDAVQLEIFDRLVRSVRYFILRDDAIAYYIIEFTNAVQGDAVVAIGSYHLAAVTNKLIENCESPFAPVPPDKYKVD